MTSAQQTDLIIAAQWLIQQLSWQPERQVWECEAEAVSALINALLAVGHSDGAQHDT